MSRRIVARWQDASGKGLEHLILTVDEGGLVAEAIVLAGEDADYAIVQYELRCDRLWCLREARIMVLRDQRALELRSNGEGRWTDGAGAALPQLEGAIDIDISATPFTNTLPIRRLAWAKGQSADLRMAYVRVPELSVTADPQRYTCLAPGRRFRYESLDSDFTREIEVDGDGLVVSYPGLFQRVV